MHQNQNINQPPPKKAETFGQKARAIQSKVAAVGKLSFMAKAAAAEQISSDTARLLVDLADRVDNITMFLAAANKQVP